jgi:TRAP-type mannitol/chloroaromatic compound transport system permease small subunit
MNRFLHFVDSLSVWVGKCFAWCIVVLTFATCYEVFVRYVLNAPTVWAFDMGVQMYGALFVMAGAYALAQDAHVRGDVLYRLMSQRTQASIDLALYILFLLPAVFALTWYGYGFAADSWFYKEVSWSSPARIQIYFFKTLIPVAGVLILLQGLAESIRCIMCIRDGYWPKRMHDVMETEEALIHQQEEVQEETR